MTDTPGKGDEVAWNTPQGKTTGTVEKVVTSRTRIGSHEVKASKDAPQVVVKSDRTGRKAAHKPAALKRT